jgi:site-specific recombinase XerD
MIKDSNPDSPGSDARGIAPQVPEPATEPRTDEPEHPLWSAWLTEGDYTQQTMEGYAREAADWLRWLGPDHDLHDVTRADVLRWMASLRAKRRAPATVARKVSAVLSYYSWAEDNDLIAVVPRPKKMPKVKSDPVRRLGKPVEEIAKVLEVAEPGLEKTLATLLAYTGVRISEATGADVSDVRIIQGRRVLQVLGKGGKPRTPPLADHAWQHMQLYLDGRTSGPLLLGVRGGRLDRRQAWRIIRTISARVGLHIYPHLFRHSAAVSMARADYKITQIAAALGHADIKTTAIYLKGLEQLDESALHGLARQLDAAAAAGLLAKKATP